MAVMSRFRLILDMSRVDGNTTGFLFWRLINLVIISEFRTASLSQNFGDSGSQSCLSMVDVTFPRYQKKQMTRRMTYRWSQCSYGVLYGQKLHILYAQLQGHLV